MLSEQESARQLRDLGGRVSEVVAANSAGESSRQLNWGHFVKGVPANWNLLDLAGECFRAMSANQRRQFRGKMNIIAGK